MGYSGYEWLWLFFAYSFSGWVLETVTAAVRQKRFVNRGLVNGPLCVIYGITGSALMLVCRDLRGIWLFLGSMIFSTLVGLFSCEMESGWLYLLSGLRDLGRSGICHHAMGSAASD